MADDWNCGGCGIEIETNAIKVMGVRYHPDCFACRKCGEKFVETGNKNVTEHQGNVFCAICYMTLDHIDVDSARQSYKGPLLKCDGCHKELTDKFTSFSDDDAKISKSYCANCLNLSPPCAACALPIASDPVFHPPLGHFHQNCFICSKCGKDADGSFKGRLMCQSCQKVLLADPCEICNELILDETKMVVALKTRFHSKCFTCSICKINLEDSIRVLVDGRLYCKVHK